MTSCFAEPTFDFTPFVLDPILDTREYFYYMSDQANYTSSTCKSDHTNNGDRGFHQGQESASLTELDHVRSSDRMFGTNGRGSPTNLTVSDCASQHLNDGTASSSTTSSDFVLDPACDRNNSHMKRHAYHGNTNRDAFVPSYKQQQQQRWSEEEMKLEVLCFDAGQTSLPCHT